jgi:hypothetical protein
LERESVTDVEGVVDLEDVAIEDASGVFDAGESFVLVKG